MTGSSASAPCLRRGLKSTGWIELLPFAVHESPRHSEEQARDMRSISDARNDWREAQYKKDEREDQALPIQVQSRRGIEASANPDVANQAVVHSGHPPENRVLAEVVLREIRSHSHH